MYFYLETVNFIYTGKIRRISFSGKVYVAIFMNCLEFYETLSGFISKKNCTLFDLTQFMLEYKPIPLQTEIEKLLLKSFANTGSCVLSALYAFLTDYES